MSTLWVQRYRINREHSMKKVTVSAPGSLMLFGEHAVLYGHSAIVCAINQRIYVTLLPRTDSLICITSETLGQMQTNLSNFSISPPFHFVLTTINYYRKSLPHGFDLHIRSEFSHTVGLGSSAAVTVATALAVTKAFQITASFSDIVHAGIQTVQSVQGVGSGADIAASVYGGIINYKIDGPEIIPLKHNPPLTLVYSGYKTTTADVIHQVTTKKQQYPQLINAAFVLIGECSIAATQAIQEKNWINLGEICNIQQGAMDALGVSDPHLSNIIYRLRTEENIMGAKISGSGLGDCVVAIGHTKKPSNELPCLAIEVSNQGMMTHE